MFPQWRGNQKQELMPAVIIKWADQVYICHWIPSMRTLKLCYGMITHKFYGGQGLHFKIDLTKRNYQLKVETIWEDCAHLEIEGLTGIKNFVLWEDGLKGAISDQDLEQNRLQQIRMTLKLPEHSSYQTRIFGSVDHVSKQIDSKLRGSNLSIDVLSKGSSVNLKYIQMDTASVNNPFGKVKVGTLVAGLCRIQSMDFEAQKVMVSNKLDLKSKHAYLRSLILQNSTADIRTQVFRCESIQGKTSIVGSTSIRVDRLFAGVDGVSIDSPDYNLKVESGTGTIRGKGSVQLGSTHTGEIVDVSEGVKQIR